MSDAARPVVAVVPEPHRGGCTPSGPLAIAQVLVTRLIAADTEHEYVVAGARELAPAGARVVSVNEVIRGEAEGLPRVVAG